MQLISDAPRSFPIGLMPINLQLLLSWFSFQISPPIRREAALALNAWIAPLDEMDVPLVAISMSPVELARDAVRVFY